MAGQQLTEWEGLVLLDSHQVMRLSITTGLAAFFFCKHSKGLTESPKALPAASSCLPAPDLSPYSRPSSAGFLANLTFVPDQVVAKENEQDEQQEDDESHDPANNGVVGAGG